MRLWDFAVWKMLFNFTAKSDNQMKKIFACIIVAVVAMNLCVGFAQKYESKVNKYAGAKKEYEFPVIKGIDNNSPITVEFFNGEQEVSLHGTSAVIEHIHVYMTSDGILHVEATAPVEINEKTYAVLMVKARDIDSFSQSGSGKILMTDKVNIPGTIRFNVSGEGNIEASSIYATNVEGTDSGEGDVQITFLRCDNLDLTLSGTGDILIDDMEGKNVTLRSTGEGDIHFEELVCDSYNVNFDARGHINVLSGMAGRGTINASGKGAVRMQEFETEDITVHAGGTCKVFCNATDSISATTSGSGRIRQCGSAPIPAGNPDIYRL